MLRWIGYAAGVARNDSREMKYLHVTDDEEVVAIPVPDDWLLDTASLGYEVWVHAPSELKGQARTAPTLLEAALLVKKDMEHLLNLGAKDD